MSAAARAVVPGRARRFWTILGIFVAVAPLVTAVIMISLMLGIGMTVPERVPVLFPCQWAFSLPLALVSGALFGGFAAFRGRARLWIALAPALLMLPAINLALGVRWSDVDVVYVAAALALFALPLALAWALSRPWHR